MKYISVADDENNEIGIIRDIEDLTSDQKDIVVNELDNRYYSPEILEIVSVQDKLGYVYIEMRIQNKNSKVHVKSCAVKDVSRNIRMLSDKSIIIFDVDGNRYIVSDLFSLNKNCLKRLDSYLF
jgi:predicted glycosyltransferase